MTPGARPGPDRDAGITLVEVMVSMGVMSVIMVLFTLSTVQVHRVVNKNEAISRAQSAVNVAFLRLDREVRYASGISVPGASGGNFYVEYATGQTTTTATCVQLRLRPADQQLQRRTARLTLASGVLSALTGWIPIASNVASTTQPFTRTPPSGLLETADASKTFYAQRLRVTFTARSTLGATPTTKATDMTFTALNTSRSTASDTLCTGMRTL